MRIIVQPVAAFAVLCLCLATGCAGTYTQIGYIRDILPATVETRILPLEPSVDFSEDLARSYLAQKINATRSGIALGSTDNRGKRNFDFADLHVTLFEQTSESLTRKEALYILELKNFCGRRAVMVGVGNAFTNSYTYTQEHEARSTAAALLTLGAKACEPLREPLEAELPPQE